MRSEQKFRNIQKALHDRQLKIDNGILEKNSNIKIRFEKESSDIELVFYLITFMDKI